MFRTKLGEIIVAAWADSKLLSTLQKDPKHVFKSFGLNPPEELNISIHVNDHDTEHVIADTAWRNKYGPDFMLRLNKDSKTTLKSIGYGVVEGVDYKILFNTSSHMNIIIPRKPSYYECSIEQIR